MIWTFLIVGYIATMIFGFKTEFDFLFGPRESWSSSTNLLIDARIREAARVISETTTSPDAALIALAESCPESIDRDLWESRVCNLVQSSKKNPGL